MKSAKKDSNRRQKIWRELRDWMYHLFLAGLFFYFLTVFGFQAFPVQGTGMSPVLEEGQRVLVKKYAYSWSAPKRGELVAFWFPPEPDQTRLSRILGLPGDRISIRIGEIYLNQQRLSSELFSSTIPSEENLPEILVPPGYYFVLSDNLKAREDSRRWGLIPRRYIRGKAFLRFWPFETWESLSDKPFPASERAIPLSPEGPA